METHGTSNASAQDDAHNPLSGGLSITAFALFQRSRMETGTSEPTRDLDRSWSTWSLGSKAS